MFVAPIIKIILLTISYKIINMKKVFGILFVVFGIVCLPSVFSPSPAEMIGRIIGWALTSVLPAYLLLRKSNKKENKEENR